MREILESVIQEAGYKLSDHQLDKFYLYLQEIIKWNKVHNITGLRDPELIVKRHFIDSLGVCKCFKKAGLDWKGKSFADVGSGAVFPGVPLKIYLEDIDMNLVESVAKKCSFLEYLKVKLGEDYKVFCCRAEELRTTFDVVIARALGRFEDVIGLLEDLAREYVFVMVGRNFREELISAYDLRVCEGYAPGMKTHILWKKLRV